MKSILLPITSTLSVGVGSRILETIYMLVSLFVRSITQKNSPGDEIAKRDLMIGGLATLEESHSHTPDREICSEGVIPLGLSS